MPLVCKNPSYWSMEKVTLCIWGSLLGSILNRIHVEGATEDQLKIFYSCLYRAHLFPRAWYEDHFDIGLAGHVSVAGEAGNAQDLNRLQSSRATCSGVWPFFASSLVLAPSTISTSAASSLPS